MARCSAGWRAWQSLARSHLVDEYDRRMRMLSPQVARRASKTLAGGVTDCVKILTQSRQPPVSTYDEPRPGGAMEISEHFIPPSSCADKQKRPPQLPPALQHMSRSHSGRILSGVVDALRLSWCAIRPR